MRRCFFEKMQDEEEYIFADRMRGKLISFKVQKTIKQVTFDRHIRAYRVKWKGMKWNGIS